MILWGRMGIGDFFKKAVVSGIALTAVGAVAKHQLDRSAGPEPETDDAVLSEFMKNATPPAKDPRGGINFSVGPTNFHLEKSRAADFDKILEYIPVADSTVRFGKWHVSQDVLNANTEVAFKFGLPLSLMMKIQGVESRFDRYSRNKDTGACGLGQFVPATLYEKTYKYADAMGFAGLKQMVERYDPKAGTEEAKVKGYKPTFNYRPVDAGAAETLGVFCTDARYNAHLKGQYLASNIARLQTQLADLSPKSGYYPLTSVEVYGAHFAGENRIVRMIRALHDPKKAAEPASKFFDSAEVKQNRPYFLDDQNRARSIAGFFANLAELKGLGTDVMPDMRGFKIPQGEVSIGNVDVLIGGLQKLSIDGRAPRYTPQLESREIVEAKFIPVQKASVPVPAPRPKTHRPG